MTDYCAFSNDHKCPNQLTRYELEEADELCHRNRIEIEHLQGYIKILM